MKEDSIRILKKIVIIIPAVLLLPLGLSLYIFADIGADVLTSFQQGVAKITNIGIGNVVTIFNVTVLVVFLFINRRLINIGSVMMVLATGPLITLYFNILTLIFPYKFSFFINLLLVFLGTIFVAVAISIFVTVNLGVSPVDMIVITISRLVQKSYGVGMYIFFGITLILALIVGGKIGIGTIINLLFLGKLSDFFIKIFKPYILRMTDMTV